MFKILSALVLAATLLSCNGNGAKTDEAAAGATTDTTATAAATETPAVQTLMQTVNAKFVEFSLGDAEHYTFEDKSGKTWEFGGCDDPNVKFGVELPAAEANETNQGWGSNKDLQGKWFDLKYFVRKQPLYQDGPEGDVQVIAEAKMVQ